MHVVAVPFSGWRCDGVTLVLGWFEMAFCGANAGIAGQWPRSTVYRPPCQRPGHPFLGAEAAQASRAGLPRYCVSFGLEVSGMKAGYASTRGARKTDQRIRAAMNTLADPKYCEIWFLVSA